MAQNVYYNDWVENINKMDEDELISTLHNCIGYNPEYIRLLNDRLTKEFHYTQQQLDDAQIRAEVKYHNDRIAAETDKQLGLLGKIIAIVSLIFLNGFAVVVIIILQNWKVRNSLGKKYYLYNEESRKWLKKCVLSFIFICLIIIVVNFIIKLFLL